MATNDTTAPATKKESVLHRLYTGTGAFDLVGKRKRFYVFFAVLILVCLASIIFRGFNLGIDFTGGTRISLPAQGAHGTISTSAVEKSFNDTLGFEPAATQTVGNGNSSTIQIRSETLDNAQVTKLKDALFKEFQPLNASGDPSERAISDSAVSASWGGEISQKALIALGVFLVAVVIFLAVYFDLRMAAAALVSLLHDILVTAGVYSLIGFEVTPATVIGLLTILGFSLYDTVVVFDKVRENTGELSSMSRLTYSEAANRAVNQTLVRSLNTSLASLLPIGALLVVGAVLLGAETIKDLSLALFVGVAAGTYSSIFIATPFLALWKETEPRNRQLTARVARLAAAGAAEETPARAGQVASRGSRKPVEAPAGAGGRRRKDDGGRRPAEEAPVLEADAPNGLHLEADEEIEEVEEPARAAAPAPRQPQKPRPAQQRRKSSGRQPSRSAKRRRR